MPTADSEPHGKAAQWLRAARNVVVFTGAGVSAESGIATFRDVGGFWSQFPPEQFATMPGLMKTAFSRPQRIVEFLLALLEPVANARPNLAHQAIASLEHSARVMVVTQNVDGLHQESGSKIVHEIHGSLFDVVTHDRHFVRRLSRHELKEVVEALHAACETTLNLHQLARAIYPLADVVGFAHRPSLVLFGEPMAEPAWSRALGAVEECDLMLVVGTSELVHPAASLPDKARAGGAKLVRIDPEPGLGDLWLQGKAGEILPELCRQAFA